MTYRVYQHMANVHCHAFDEVARALTAAMVDLGHECTWSDTRLKKGATNIVLGAQHVPRRRISTAYIVYQMEQLSEASPFWTPQYQEVLAQADAVWDMSDVNVRFLKEHGIDAVHVPVGYHECNETIPRGVPREVDLLFYGSMNERRNAILERLNKSFKIGIVPFGVYGANRDGCISRSRAVLNMHFYETALMEQPRVAYLLNNAVPVYSEEAVDDPWPGIKVGNIDLMVEPQDFSGTYIHDRIGILQYEMFKELYPMTRFLKAVL